MYTSPTPSPTPGERECLRLHLRTADHRRRRTWRGLPGRRRAHRPGAGHADAIGAPGRRAPGRGHRPQAVSLLDRRAAVRLTPLHLTAAPGAALAAAAAHRRPGPGWRAPAAGPARRAAPDLLDGARPGRAGLAGEPGRPPVPAHHVGELRRPGGPVQVISATQITDRLPSARQRARHRDQERRQREERGLHGTPRRRRCSRARRCPPGAALVSLDGHFTLTMRRNGNLVLRDRHRQTAVGHRHRRAIRRLPVHAEQRQPGPVRRERRQDPVVDRDRRARPGRPGRPGQREPGPVRRHGADLECGQPGQQADLGRDPAAGLVPQLRHRLPPGHAHQREPGPDPRGPHGVVQRDRGPPGRDAHHAGRRQPGRGQAARRYGPAAPAGTPGPG